MGGGCSSNNCCFAEGLLEALGGTAGGCAAAGALAGDGLLPALGCALFAIPIPFTCPHVNTMGSTSNVYIYICYIYENSHSFLFLAFSKSSLNGSCGALVECKIFVGS